MVKTAFVIPYFGKFNNFFQLFLNSCAKNPEYTWLIFTNDHSCYSYPSNVQVFYCDFNTVCDLIRKKINKNAIISRPYKLCDYKPCYGLIFEDYLHNYDFWGYCDTDMIFGNLSHFIKPEMYTQYDKLFFLGHCTLVRNTTELNSIFLKEPEFIKVYREEENHSFDEEFQNSINTIFQRKQKNLLLKEYEANIYVKSSSFHITRYDFIYGKYINLEQKNLFFIWNNGVLSGIWEKNDRFMQEEYMYIHLQSRKMKVKITNETRFKIIPNSFEVLEKENFKDIQKKHFNIHYFRVRTKNLIIKIKNAIHKYHNNVFSYFKRFHKN